MTDELKPMRAVVEFMPGELPRNMKTLGVPGPRLTCRVTVEDQDTGECIYAVFNPFDVGAHISRDLRAGIVGTAEKVVAAIARDLTGGDA